MSPRGSFSMRRRLLLWLVVPLLLLCGLLLVQSWFSARAAADRAYDRLLQASALAIAERVVLRDGVVDVDLPYAALQMLASVSQDRVFYRITGPAGEFVTGYPDLPPSPAGVARIDDPEARFVDATYRNEVIRIALLDKPVIAGRIRVEVAQTRGDRRLLTRELATDTAWRLLLLIAVAGLIIAIGVQRSLAPLALLRQELGQRSARDLDPLQSPVPREVAPVVAAINQLMARLERSLEVMRRFIADAAHQLRTPLAVLQTRIELARREHDAATLRQALHQLHDSVQRTTRLANQLLDHARASADAGALDIVPLDLNELAAEVTRELVPLALKRDMDLGFEADRAVTVQGDELLLRELLKNLIDNAIRYCPSGACITVRVAATATGCCLEVEDDGPGIPPAERERVFDRFYRSPGTDTEGSGLGLAIVREVVRVHGGRITLGEGSEGKGLRVRVSLPVVGPLA